MFYLLERQSVKEELPSKWLQHQVWAKQKQVPGTPSGSPTWLAGAWILRPPSAAFPGELQGTEFDTGSQNSDSYSNMGYWHCKQQLNQPYHNPQCRPPKLILRDVVAMHRYCRYTIVTTVSFLRFCYTSVIHSHDVNTYFLFYQCESILF